MQLHTNRLLRPGVCSLFRRRIGGVEEDAEIELSSGPGQETRVEIWPDWNIRSNIFDIKHWRPIRCFRFREALVDSPGKDVQDAQSNAFDQEAQRNKKCTT